MLGIISILLLILSLVLAIAENPLGLITVMGVFVCVIADAD